MDSPFDEKELFAAPRVSQGSPALSLASTLLLTESLQLTTSLVKLTFHVDTSERTILWRDALQQNTSVKNITLVYEVDPDHNNSRLAEECIRAAAAVQHLCVWEHV